MLFLAACNVPAQWQKPDVERAALDSDLLQCRHAGQQQSLRAYASQLNFPFNSPPFWAGSWQPSRDRWNRSVEADREFAEGRFTADCMRDKGYQRTSPRASGSL
jgi:hypothetical protein